MPLHFDGPGDCNCNHSTIEHLGNDHDARFFRCEACRKVFIVQGGMTLALPPAQQQHNLALERDPAAGADLIRVARRSASE